jgi:hypothetical protein
MIPKYSFIWAWIVTLLSQVLLTFLGYYYTKNIIKFMLPFSFIVKNIFIWIIVFILWYYLINNFSIWLYSDFIIYWWVLFWCYSYILYKEFKS